MRKSNISNALKGLLIAAGVIIVCILIALAFGIVRNGKNYTNNGNNQFSSMMSPYDDLEISSYDGLAVSGTEVKTVIAKFVDESLSIKVYTKENLLNEKNGVTETNKLYTIYDSTHKVIDEDKVSPNYINPLANFTGKVYRNENNIIYMIEFKQE